MRDGTTQGVFCFLILSLTVLFSASGAVVPEKGGGPHLKKNEEGKTVVVGERFRLVLPAGYWEVETPQDIARRTGPTGGGCAPGGSQVPSSLLLMVRNEDARAAMTLELKKTGFLMRGKEDLDTYIDERMKKLEEQGRGSLTIEDTGRQNRDGMIVFKTLLSASGKGGTQRYLLVDYFVRPRGQKARLYQGGCMASGAAYERYGEDLEAMADSFVYTGPMAPSFFAPEAAAEQVPEVQDQPDILQQCGGPVSGMAIALVGVMIVYMMWRKHKEKSSF